MLSVVQSQAFTLVIKDKKIESIGKHHFDQKTICLPTTITLKKNMLVELVSVN